MSRWNIEDRHSRLAGGVFAHVCQRLRKYIHTCRAALLIIYHHRACIRVRPFAHHPLGTSPSGNVPLVEHRIVKKDEWVVLNDPTIGIPTEATDYRSRRPDEHRAMGPTGVYLEMEWGLDLDWYDHEACTSSYH